MLIRGDSLSYDVLLVVPLAALLLLSYRKLRTYLSRRLIIRNNGCRPLPRLPSWDPLLGLDNVSAMQKSYEEGRRCAAFREQHTVYGATFGANLMGHARWFTMDPANLRAILSTDFANWGVQPVRLPAWGPLLGAGVMDTDGQHWRTSRGLVQPLFRHRDIGTLSSFSLHVDRMLSRVPGDGSTVDLQPLFNCLILDFTTEFLFGVSVGSLTDAPEPNIERFVDCFKGAQAVVGQRTQFPWRRLLPPGRRFTDLCATVRGIADGYIEAARRRRTTKDDDREKVADRDVEEGKYILADELLKLTDDTVMVRSQLLNTFIAAYDTTTVLMTNVFWNLARHPDMYQRLRDEVLRLPELPTSFEGLKRVNYLRHVIMETARFTPVVGQSARVALSDTVLPTGGGPARDAPVFVPRGTVMQFNFWALHRRPEAFGADADVFNPDRWDHITPGTYDFLPFIGGPRVCPGQQIALSQTAYVVASIVRQHRSIENRDPVEDMVETYRIHTISRHGAKVAFRS